MPRRTMLSALLVLAAMAALFVAAPGRAGESVKTIRVGACISTTGEFGPDGEVILAGIRMRMDEFNENQEISGVRMELIHRDDQSTPAGAVAAYEQLVLRDGVDAVIGPMPTALMAAVNPLARKHKKVTISPWSTNPAIGRDDDWCFRILFDDDFQGAALARYIRSQLGLTRAGAIVNERAEYSKSVFWAFRNAFEEAGGKVVATEYYDWQYNDEESGHQFGKLVENVMAAGPEIIFLPVYTADVALIIRESLATGAKARFCGGDTWQNDTVFLAAGRNIEDAFFISGANFSSKTPAMRRFMDVFEDSHDPHAQPYSVLGYDCLSLLIEAMKNGLDADSIREGMYRIKDFELASGRISIDREKGISKQGFIYNIEKQGFAYVPVLGVAVD